MTQRPSASIEVVLALAIGCAATPAPTREAAATSAPAQVTITGCAAKPMQPEEIERAANETRAWIPEKLEVAAVRGGIQVEHRVRHACCLQGAVESQVSGTTVTLREMLSGEGCRCMCGSTLRTLVSVPAGTYAVVVRVDESGRVRDLPGRSVTVQK